MKASGWQPHQFSSYYYTGALADGTNYTPADRTIVHMALLEAGVVIATQDFYVLDASSAKGICDAFAQNLNANKSCMVGPIYCDGDNAFRNATGAGKTLYLWGLTMG